MNDVITIENTEMKIKEYKGQRVVTFKDIDAVHQRPTGTAKRNFNKNKRRFVEGEDYIKVCVDEIRTSKIMDISSKARADIVMLTESGYLMIVKSLTDDLSWKVQRQLVNAYFKVREVQKDRLYDDFVPRVPIVQDWYERNKGRMYRLCRDCNNSMKYMYHCILKRVSEKYDLNAAREIYKNEVGHYPPYAIDVVRYFPELAAEADAYLDRIERVIYR